MGTLEDGLAIVGLSFFLHVFHGCFQCLSIYIICYYFLLLFIVISYCLLLIIIIYYCLLVFIYIFSLFLGCMLIMHYEHIYMRDMHVCYLCR